MTDETDWLRLICIPTLLSFAAGWAEGWTSSGRSDVSVIWHQSPENREKGSVTINFEGVHVWAQFSVWDSGDTSREAMLVETGDLLFQEYDRISTEEELASLIRRVVAACETQ